MIFGREGRYEPLSLRLLVGFFAFLIGVAATALLIYPRQTLVENKKASEQTVSAPPAKPQKAIVSGLAGEGISEDGYATSFSDRDYSDGTYVHQLSTFYNSPKQANAALAKRLEKAVEIIRREPNLDDRGVKVGERVVATFTSAPGAKSVSAELLWTDGSRYVAQQRASVQDILEDLDDEP